MDIRHYHLSIPDGVWLGQTPGEHTLSWHDIRLKESERELSHLSAFLRDIGADEEIVTLCTLPMRFPSVEVSRSGVFPISSVTLPYIFMWLFSFLCLNCFPFILIRNRAEYNFR